MRKCEHCNYPLEGLPKFLKCPSCGKDLNVDNFETEKVNLPQQSDKVTGTTETKKVNEPEKKSWSPHFESAIKKYLDFRASEDTLFAKTYAKENKNLDDCMKYIINTVKESGIAGFHDEEIYSMAVHYYDEDDIDVKGDLKCEVVVNHQVVLTEEEKAEARKEAIKKAQEVELNKIKRKTKKVEVQSDQASLF